MKTIAETSKAEDWVLQVNQENGLLQICKNGKFETNQAAVDFVYKKALYEHSPIHKMAYYLCIYSGNWDIGLAREILPIVYVQLENGEVVEGQVTGRKLMFPLVIIRDEKYGDVEFEFSWQSIVDALNNNRPLKV